MIESLSPLQLAILVGLILFAAFVILLDGVGSPFATADTAVWLFLPKQRELARLTLELTMRAGGKRLRRYRFNVTLES